jgi:hypothetical protein
MIRSVPCLTVVKAEMIAVFYASQANEFGAEAGGAVQQAKEAL